MSHQPREEILVTQYSLNESVSSELPPSAGSRNMAMGRLSRTAAILQVCICPYDSLIASHLVIVSDLRDKVGHLGVGQMNNGMMLISGDDYDLCSAPCFMGYIYAITIC